MVSIRLSRGGAKKRPFYHIVVTDQRNRRDGRYIERLGFFNPIARGGEQKLKIDIARIEYWVENGAQPSPRVAALVETYRKSPPEVESVTEAETPATETKPEKVEAKQAEPKTEEAAPAEADVAEAAEAESESAAAKKAATKKTAAKKAATKKTAAKKTAKKKATTKKATAKKTATKKAASKKAAAKKDDATDAGSAEVKNSDD